MNQTPKRPISVWIAQIILLLVIVSLLLLGYYSLAYMTSATAPLAALIVGLVVFFLVLYSVAFWGLATRRPLGRWLTVGLFSLLILNSIGRIFVDPNITQPTNGPQLLGYIIGALIFVVPLVLLVFFLTTSAKVSLFFSKQEDDIQDPPPVETYAKDFNQ